jgi:hypothetical protein
MNQTDRDPGVQWKKSRRWGVASQTRNRLGPFDVVALALRLAAIALLCTVAWIHLHLWQSGYRHIPTIGPLFLAAVLAAAGVAVLLLARPSRTLAILALAVDAGILAALIGSINTGLFGFTESLDAPFVVESMVIETMAALAVALWITVDRMAQNQHRPIKLPTAAEHVHPNDRLSPKRTGPTWHDPRPSAS